MEGFADESIRRDRYMMCVAVIRPDQLGSMRRAVRGLCLPGQRNLHMREESDRRKRSIISCLCDLGVRCRVYVGRGRERDARALCVSKLMEDLAAEGLVRLVLETRHGRDVEDRNTIFPIVRKLGLNQLRYEHLRPSEEPLLWIPDAVAWAYGAGGDWTRRVAPVVEKVA